MELLILLGICALLLCVEGGCAGVIIVAVVYFVLKACGVI